MDLSIRQERSGTSEKAEEVTILAKRTGLKLIQLYSPA